MSRAPAKDVVAGPESDRFPEAPHPRETLGFFGNAAAEAALLTAYKQSRLAHAWIIGGPEGVGKATLAWRFARFLLAHPDPTSPHVQEAASLEVPGDAAAARRIAGLAVADIHLLRRSWNDKTKKFYTEIRIDEVRDIIHKIHRASATGGWRIVIVDSADDLNRSSANALLKLIEEPPERALFLLVAHQPGRILPTIRSRCRRLLLEALQPDDIAAAVRALGPPYAQVAEATLREASESSEGGVREALRLLDEDNLGFDRTLRAMFELLPQIEWGAVHQLADRLAGYENEAAFETFMSMLYRHMDAAVRRGAGSGAAPDRLAGYAAAWEDIATALRETQVFNFDRRALVLSIFLRLERLGSL